MSADEITVTAFNALFDVLNNNVQQVSRSDGSTAELQRRGGGDDLYWMSAYPTSVIPSISEDDTGPFEYGDSMQRDSYPFGVLPSPDKETQRNSIRVFDDRIEYDVTIVAVKAEDITRFESKITTAIRTNRAAFWDAGFHDVGTGVGSGNMSHHGDMKLHVYTLPVYMKYSSKVESGG